MSCGNDEKRGNGVFSEDLHLSVHMHFCVSFEYLHKR